MSTSTTTEEDTELRDLVATTLDNTGVLGKIKAQLRANVYLALEKGDAGVKSKSGLVNSDLCSFLSTTNGRLVASLVREFLQFFNLDFSLAVFDPETNIGRDFKYRERDKLIEALGLTELTDKKSPLLSEIMRLSKVSVLKSESPTPTEISIEDQHTSAATSLADDLVGEDKTSDGDRTETSTPEILLKDSPDLMIGRTFKQEKHVLSKSSDQKFDRDIKLGVEEEIGKTNILNGHGGVGKKEVSKVTGKDSTFLSDLPPLGSLAKSSIGDLPPLHSLSGARGNSLAPLGGGNSLASLGGGNSMVPLGGGHSFAPLGGHLSLSSSGSDNGHIGTSCTKPAPAGSADLKNLKAPSFGFESDHVLSEKDEFINKRDSNLKNVKKVLADSSPDVTENIEEDLDSFLNSEISAGDDLTRDETVVNSDVSLKVDYVESL